MPATKRDHVPDGHERPHARGGTFGVQQHDWPMRSARARQRKIVVRQDFARATRGRAQKIKERRVAFAWQQRGIRTVLMHFTVKTATISPLLESVVQSRESSFSREQYEILYTFLAVSLLSETLVGEDVLF